MHVIKYKSSIYYFKNDLSEDNDKFIERCWFIVKNINNNNSYEYIKNLSHIWINHKYLNTIYDDSIMKELYSMNCV